MAKADTVYSMFGMETPQQVAARRLKEQTELLAPYQRDPFQSAGAAIGMGLMRLFGPEDQQMARSQMGEAVIQSARMDYAREQKMKEAEAKAAQQEALDARLSGLEGAIASEAGTGMLPDVQPKAPTDAELMMQRLTKAAGLYDTIADRLDAAGFSVEAENARAKARESIGGLLTVRKQLADIGLAEAKAKAESVIKPTATGTNMVTIPGRGDEPFQFAVVNGIPSFKDRDQKWYPVPSEAQFVPRDQSTVKPGGLSKSEVEVIVPYLEADPMIAGLDDKDAARFATDVGAEIDRIIATPGNKLSRAEAAQIAIAKFKKLIKENDSVWTNIGIGADYIYSGPGQSLGDTPARDVAVPTEKPQASTADPEGSVRRYVGNRVALFDEKTKKFIRYVD